MLKNESSRNGDHSRGRERTKGEEKRKEPRRATFTFTLSMVTIADTSTLARPGIHCTTTTLHGRTKIAIWILRGQETFQPL